MQRLNRPGILVLLLTLLSVGCDNHTPASPSDCSSLTLSPTTQSVGSDGGAGVVTVSAPASCTWTASSSASWLQITEGSRGTGDGRITYAAAYNITVNERSATIAVAARTATVVQAGLSVPGGCSYRISPANRAAPAAGTAFRVDVTAPFGCLWSWTSNAGWITLEIDSDHTGPTGNGNGPLVVVVAANPDAAPRTGTATIAGQTLTVTQDGTGAAACTYALDGTSASFLAAGGTGTLSIVTSPPCSWMAEPSATGEDWVRVGSPSRGAGSQIVPFTVLPNATFTGRTGGIYVNGDSGNARLTFTVNQSGASCLYSVSPGATSFGAGGGTASFQVTAQPDSCSWTVTASDWIQVLAGSAGTGNGLVTFSAGSNAGGARTGSVVVAGLSGQNPPATHTVTQTGATD